MLVVVALVIRRRLRPVFVVLGALAAAEGVGSLLYHGGRGDAAQFLHDVALVAALGFIAGWHVGRLTGRADAGALAGTVVTVAAGSLVWALAPSATNVMVGVLVAATVGAELVARRRGLRRGLERAARRPRRRRRRVWWPGRRTARCATPARGSSRTAAGTS